MVNRKQKWPLHRLVVYNSSYIPYFCSFSNVTQAPPLGLISLEPLCKYTLTSPNIKSGEVYNMEVVPECSWMSPILNYLQTDGLPLDKREAIRIWKQATKYVVLSVKLYKTGGLLPCYSALSIKLPWWLQKYTRKPVAVILPENPHP